MPAGTPVFQQLQYFQESRHRIAIVVNEYGELQGLVTPEDIIEELIGEFTTPFRVAPVRAAAGTRDGECIVAGSMPLRELNRWLHLTLPTDGPKTLNGLILEILEEIPDGDVCVHIARQQTRSHAQRRPGDPHRQNVQAAGAAPKTVKSLRG